MEQAFSEIPAEEQQRVILMQQRVEKVHKAGHMLVLKSSRHLIHFSDAVKYLMLRSIGRVKRLPGIVASLQAKKHLAGILNESLKGLSATFRLLLKKTFCTTINKRN
jgi:hypothetical protein